VTGSQSQSATRDLAVGRLDDLGGFPDCLIPDSGVDRFVHRLTRASGAIWAIGGKTRRAPFFSRRNGGVEIPDHLDALRRQGGLGAAMRMPGEEPG
jgi:hypothetical protein